MSEAEEIRGFKPSRRDCLDTLFLFVLIPMIPVYELSIPEYDVSHEFDIPGVSAKMDVCIRKHFSGKIIIRGLGMQDHSEMNIDKMVETIKKLGHDRYDPERAGDRYENVDDKHIDIFALERNIDNDDKIMEQFVDSFYTWPKKFGEPPTRLNILIIYDPEQLEQVVHRYEGRDDIKDDGYVFKNKEKASEAVLGIIKVL